MIDEACRLILAREPDAVRTIYLFGSHADGTAVDTSDLDLAVITAAADPSALQARLRAALHAAGLTTVDLLALDRDALLATGHFRIERGSTLLYGDDIRPRLPPITLDAYLRHYGAAPLVYIGPVLRGIDPPPAQLDYPDPEGEFFGYDKPTLPPHGEPVHNIKALVACACWIATLTVGLRTGQMLTSKAEAVRVYQEAIADEWAPLIRDLHDLGRQRWSYRLPSAPAERHDLRALCERMLGLERHYLTLTS